MKKLLKYLKQYRKECFVAPFFKMLEAITELFVPLVVASIIDTGILKGDVAYIIKMTGVLVAIAVINFLFLIVAQFFAAKAAVGFAQNLRYALMGHIGRFSYTQLDRLGAPTLITRMTSDVNQVQTGVNLTLRLALRSPFVVFGSMIMAFTIDKTAAMVFLVAIIALSLCVFGIMLICRPLYKKVQGLLDNVLKTTRENLTGVRVIRAFCKEDAEQEEFEQSSKALAAMQKRVGRISAILNPVTLIIVNLAVIFLIYIGAIRIELGLMTQGMVVALYNYMAQILIELIKLADLIVNITKSIACGNRISAVLELPAENETDGGTTDCSFDTLEFCDVSFLYDGAGENSLEHISFKASIGETVGIIGGTGSGKTTLVNLIPAFYKVSSGEILIGNKNVNDLNRKALRSAVGVVPQKAELFHGTIRENLLWGDESASDEDLFAALKIAQGEEIVRAREKGLDAEIRQGGKNLSGGQRQRLTIARALTKKPKILILDDSFSALDFATDKRLRTGLKEFSQNTLTLLVSQRISSVMHADKILVLDDGRLVGNGTHEELLKTCDVYREIYQSQFKKEAAQ